MKGSGRMTKLMDSANTYIRMGRSTLATGKRTNRTDKDWRLGLMELNMKGTMWKGRSTDKECCTSLMGVFTKGSSSITI